MKPINQITPEQLEALLTELVMGKVNVGDIMAQVQLLLKEVADQTLYMERERVLAGKEESDMGAVELTANYYTMDATLPPTSNLPLFYSYGDLETLN